MTGLRSGATTELAKDLEDWGPRIGADVGEPVTSGRVLHDADGVQTGVWRCTPGGWVIDDRPDSESILILEGRARLTDADGHAVELGPGDAVVLPLGWSGRWDILETVTKFYVVTSYPTS